MINLLNEKVKHVKYGLGLIVCEMDNKVDIQFDSLESKKCFVFPDAFEQFLMLENQDLQKECMEIYRLKKEQNLKEVEEKKLIMEQKEQERKSQKNEQLKKKKKEPAKKIKQIKQI